LQIALAEPEADVAQGAVNVAGIFEKHPA
jgi:hypothetical protein